MTIHPAVQRTISKFEAYELHAARSGREVMEALTSAIADSSAATLEHLAFDLDLNIDALLQVLPMYAPPVNVMHLVRSRVERAQSSRASVEELQADIAHTADSYRDWSQRAREKIATYASHLIPNGGVVSTFTLSETVLGTLRQARQAGVEFSVIVTESRPNLDGRTTARTLAEAGVDVELSLDACVGEMIPQSDVMLVGAEAILPDGSAVCKVGTYPSALVAKTHGVPVYVLVDTLKFHPTALFGQKPWLDALQRGDILEAETAPRAAVRGHLFDRTPAELISAVVTERGLVHPTQVSQWMLEMPISDSIVVRLKDRKPRRPEGG